MISLRLASSEGEEGVSRPPGVARGAAWSSPACSCPALSAKPSSAGHGGCARGMEGFGGVEWTWLGCRGGASCLAAEQPHSSQCMLFISSAGLAMTELAMTLHGQPKSGLPHPKCAREKTI